MNPTKGSGQIIFGLINLVIVSALFGLIASALAGTYNLTPWVAGLGCGGGVLAAGLILGYLIVFKVGNNSDAEGEPE